MAEKQLSERMDEVFALEEFPQNIVVWIGHWREEVAQLEDEIEARKDES